MTATDEQTKACTECGKTQPLTEFYPHPRGKFGRQSRCRTCDNSRSRHTTATRVARVRGRHRATRELIRRYDAEFRDLLDYYTRVAQEELNDIRARADVAATGRPRSQKTVELPRLKPGPARSGESVLDRVDERERCTTCRDAHARGHACPACGATPDAPPATPARPEPTPAASPTPPAKPGQVTSPLCVCGHPGRRHDEDLCLVCDDCTGFTYAAEVAAS